MSNLNFEPGSTISHFRIERKLGEGGMGAVFLAEDLTLSRKVAIKFMSRSLLSRQAKPEVREALEVRFIREARSAGAINHPNICQIYEANFDSEDWYIVMEYIRGKDLVDILQDKGKFPVPEILNICTQVATGLKFAWNNYKIIHRDIKPRNIMITEDGMVKIVDLGLAKPITGGTEESALPDVTIAGTAIGTPQYMAPEQATGDTNVDFRVDIYALGATLYELCTGQKAFNERTPAMIYMAQMAKRYKPINEVRTDVPAGLISLIDDMLEPDREDRIGSYDEILERIREIAGVSVLGFTGVSQLGTSGLQTQRKRGVREYQRDDLIWNRYRVIEPFRRTRTGIFYRCQDEKENRVLWVKVVTQEKGFVPEDLEILQKNYQRLQSIQHNNLVQVLEVHRDPGTQSLIVVMEPVQGITFREFIHALFMQSLQSNVGSIYTVLEQIARSLDRLHEELGFIHHDLTPENILVMEGAYQIKFIDYGVTERAPIVFNPNEDVTQDLRIPLENLDYMAPEKWRGEPVSPMTDQYSLAVIVYEALARKLPFWTNDPENAPDTTTRSLTKMEKGKMANMRVKVLKEEVPPIPHLSRAINAVLLTAMSKDPRNRFVSNYAFIKRLGDVAGVRRKPYLAWVGGILGFLLIVGISSWFWWYHQNLQTVQRIQDSFSALEKKIRVLPLSEEGLTPFLQPALSIWDNFDSLVKQKDFYPAVKEGQRALDMLHIAYSEVSKKVSDLKKRKDGLKQQIQSRLQEKQMHPLFSAFLQDLQQQFNQEESPFLDQYVLWLEQLALSIEKSIQRMEEEDKKAQLSFRMLQDEGNLLIEQLQGMAVLDLPNLEEQIKKIVSFWDDQKREAFSISFPQLQCKKLEEAIQNIKQQESQLRILCTEVQKKAEELRTRYVNEFSKVSKQWRPLDPDRLNGVEVLAKSAMEKMEAKKYHSSIQLWTRALEELDIAIQEYVQLAEKLRQEISAIEQQCNQIHRQLCDHPLGKDLVVLPETERKKLAKLTEDHQLKEAFQQWTKVLVTYKEAEQRFSIRLQEEEIKNQEAKKARREKIQNLAQQYPVKYDLLQKHECFSELRVRPLTPQQVLEKVASGADDPETLEWLENTFAQLEQAENEIKIKHEIKTQEIRQQAINLIDQYEKELKEILQDPLAEDLIKPARSFFQTGFLAMEKKDYDLALRSFKQSLTVLAEAKKQLEILNADEKKRQEALNQRYQERVMSLKQEYDQILQQLIQSSCPGSMMEVAERKAKEAEVVCRAGNWIDGVKRWELAVVEIKNSLAEWKASQVTTQQLTQIKLAQLKQQAESQSRKFREFLEELKKDPFTQGKLTTAESLASKALEAQKQENWQQAISLWESAVQALQKLEMELHGDLATQAQQIQSQLDKMRQRVAQWEEWDPQIAELLVKYNVAVSLGQEECKYQNYRKACLHYTEAQQILGEIEQFVQTKFVPKVGQNFVVGKVGVEMVWIQPMQIWVGRYEIRNQEYRIFKPEHRSGMIEGFSLDNPDQPVCMVSYYDAVAFCVWLTKISREMKLLPDGYEFRLPTKEEWIFFASSGNPNYKYPWGNEWPPNDQQPWNLANQEMFPNEWRLKGYRDPYPVTCEVQKSGQTPWGLYGIVGNVWEWTSEAYMGKRAVFGGSWSSTDPRLAQLDLGTSNFADPQRGYDNVGFRIVLAPVKR